MGNSEFRYKRLGQYFGVVFLVPFVGYLVSLLFSMIDVSGLAYRIPVGDYPSVWGAIGFLVLASLVLFEIWIFVGMAIFNLTYKITLTNASLRIQAWDFPGRKFFNQINHGYYLGEIPYESIVSVEINSWRPGIVKFLFKDGSFIILGVRALENHVEFVDQLSAKLTYEQIKDGFLKLKQPKRYKNLQAFIYSLAFAPTILLFFLMGVDNWEPRVWNEEFSSWSVRGISPDSDGTVWVSADNRKGDIYIWHISETEREHWKLPKEVCDKCDGFTISHDAKGFPKIINSEKGLSSVSAIYTWNGNAWDRSTSEAGVFNRYLNSVDAQLWGTHKGNLVSDDFTTGETKEVPSPAEALANGLELQDYKVNRDGSLLATFAAQGKSKFLYRLADGNWQPIMEFSSPDQRLWEFCQDFQGNIFALTTDVDKNQTMLGIYDMQTTQWKWMNLKLGYSDREIGYFKDMTVDSRGRIWIYGVYNENEKEGFLKFVMVANSNNDPIVPIVEYTDENSNLNFADFFVATNDRIWLGRFDLLWIDTATEELPSPYPDWVVWLKEFHDEKFGWYLLIFLGQIILAVIGTTLEYQ